MSKSPNSIEKPLAFFTLCFIAILYLVTMILHLCGVQARIVSIMNAVASILLLIVAAIAAWRYVENKQTVWKVLYFVVLLVILACIIIPQCV